MFAYNKDAVDEDGFAAPIAAYAELPYTLDPETRHYIGKEKNQTACDEQIKTVYAGYAKWAGIE